MILFLQCLFFIVDLIFIPLVIILLIIFDVFQNYQYPISFYIKF